MNLTDFDLLGERSACWAAAISVAVCDGLESARLPDTLRFSQRFDNVRDSNGLEGFSIKVWPQKATAIKSTIKRYAFHWF